ncbi:response regulator [Pseudooceanicola sp. LIPI14-2-Ac024]|uniref:response regulator n=1 Tax=Pseudooceanicola sp. LIPI14-2-Ac024 TaxID=3344875 RepID=UPI0035CF9CD5
MDDLDRMIPVPTPARPLLGLTILVIEDSRFASEAMRLLCLRSGARIRRADCLRSARRHLQVYRPSVAIVDLGLPDGSGAELIRDLAASQPRVAVILGLSGDDSAERLARAAGADGFLAKPVTGLAAFQNAILRHLPPDRQPAGPRAVSGETIRPDRLALREDMAQLAEALDRGVQGKELDYVAQFLAGVARIAGDVPLVEAAGALAASRQAGQASGAEVARIAGLVRARLAEPVVI